MRLEMPLFPGYVFVRMALVDRSRVLQVPSVVRLVGFNGHLSPLPDEEIEGMKKGLVGGVRAEPHPFLTVGRRVRIKSGPLVGRQGILLRRKGILRVVLSIDLIMRSIAVDMDVADVEPVVHRGRLSSTAPLCEYLLKTEIEQQSRPRGRRGGSSWPISRSSPRRERVFPNRGLRPSSKDLDQACKKFSHLTKVVGNKL